MSTYEDHIDIYYIFGLRSIGIVFSFT